MTTTIYKNDAKLLMGISLQDDTQLEQNNMALHVCENPENIIKNREALAATIGHSLQDFVCANQTHSATYYKVTAEDKGRGTLRAEDAIPETDALYTFEPNIVLSSFTADCVPVLFYATDTTLVGAIHSGWQGTVKEISLKTFTYLREAENVDLQNVHVHIGTALSQEKFEVDADVYTKFKALGYADDFMYFKDATKKYHIDNQLTVKKQCELAGIPASNITIEDVCTFKSAQGFSYRQDKKAGRHLSFIVRK
ncbi:Laccase domain protein [Kurthia sp. 3B1D]|uniref:Purine nucleoside phosphorylase n=1 Tax=Candidatus Kurthia intestinigallinarum TaxID=1562256 RepID=A0A433RPH8_9BACL|nr:peptidoglycan editing factor PgeF [Kurthia sp. 3B1D]RUS51944.1 Laccase domain protein [Kurthia sp. 3B1D]